MLIVVSVVFVCLFFSAGEDFLPVRMLEFFLKPGERICLNVTLLDDRMIEGREFFLIVLKDLQWGEITSTTVVSINDDDGACVCVCVCAHVVN